MPARTPMCKDLREDGDMTPEQASIAEQCLRAAESDAMAFPDILGMLGANGIEGYLVDFRDARATYYDVEGGALGLAAHASEVAVAERFDAAALVAAIREAQRLVPGYTYAGFCDKARRAGCAGYLVSLPGRRAVYFGRTGETHVELFPASD